MHVISWARSALVGGAALAIGAGLALTAGSGPATAAPGTVTVSYDCADATVTVTSTKDLSNIVYQVDGERTRIEGLTGKTYVLDLDSLDPVGSRAGKHRLEHLLRGR